MSPDADICRINSYAQPSPYWVKYVTEATDALRTHPDGGRNAALHRRVCGRYFKQRRIFQSCTHGAYKVCKVHVSSSAWRSNKRLATPFAASVPKIYFSKFVVDSDRVHLAFDSSVIPAPANAISLFLGFQVEGLGDDYNGSGYLPSISVTLRRTGTILPQYKIMPVFPPYAVPRSISCITPTLISQRHPLQILRRFECLFQPFLRLCIGIVLYREE